MGATSGLGRALAARFLEVGWHVGAAGRNCARLESLARDWPGMVTTRQIDITSADAASRLASLIDDTGGMDIYLHCSGVLPYNLDLSEEKELLTVDTNVAGFTRMISAAYRYFRDNAAPGKIAAISSIAGIRGIWQLASYCASKSYDSAYLEALRQRAHAERLPLKVVDIKPGWVRTPLLEEGRKYRLEMTLDKAAELIFRAVLKSDGPTIIGFRWRLLCALERMAVAAAQPPSLD